MNKVVEDLNQEKDNNAIEREKSRLLHVLKNKEISTVEYIKQIEQF